MSNSELRIVDKPADADGVLIIDLSNLAYRASYAYSDLMTSDGRRSGHVYGSLRLLLATLKNDIPPGAWCLVFCYDGIKSKVSRQAILPSYKSNRDESRFNPIPDVHNVVVNIPGLHIKAENREGDDAVCWIVSKCQKDGTNIILSSDRDLWALLKYPNVRILSPSLKRYVTPGDIKESYLVERPELIYLAKALFGDASDGVKGVERLLKKHVSPILNDENVTDVQEFYNAMDLSLKEVTPLKTKAKLIENRTRVEVNYKVILPDISGFGPSTVTHTAISQNNLEKLIADMHHYEARSLIDQASIFFGEPIQLHDEAR